MMSFVTPAGASGSGSPVEITSTGTYQPVNIGIAGGLVIGDDLASR